MLNDFDVMTCQPIPPVVGLSIVVDLERNEIRMTVQHNGTWQQLALAMDAIDDTGPALVKACFDGCEGLERWTLAQSLKQLAKILPTAVNWVA